MHVHKKIILGPNVINNSNRKPLVRIGVMGQILGMGVISTLEKILDIKMEEIQEFHTLPTSRRKERWEFRFSCRGHRCTLLFKLFESEEDSIFWKIDGLKFCVYGGNKYNETKKIITEIATIFGKTAEDCNTFLKDF